MIQDFTFTEMLENVDLEDHLKECLKTTDKHGNDGIRLWGAVLFSGISELIRCNKPIKDKEYIKILEKGIVLSIDNFSSFFILITHLLILINWEKMTF